MDGRGQRAIRYAVEILLGLFLLVVLLWAIRGFGVTWPAAPRVEAQSRSEGQAGAVSATLKAVFEHKYGVLALAWSPDARRLATGGPLSRPVTAWDVDRRVEAWQVDSLGTAEYLAWSPDGRYVAVAGFVPTREESGARLLDGGSGALVRHLDRPPDGKGKVTALAWSPDSRWLAASYYGRKLVVLYEAQTSRIARRIDLGAEPSDALAYSPDGRVLAIGIRAPAARWPIRVVEAGTGRTVRDLAPHDIDTPALAWSPDGRRLLAQHRGGSLSSYDWSAGRIERRVDLREGTSPAPAFFPDGRHVAAGATDVGIWSIESWTRVARFAHVARPLSVIALAPDGKHLATGGNVRAAVWAVSR